MRSPKGDILVVPEAQASEFPSTEAPRRQKELEQRVAIRRKWNLCSR